MFDLKNQTQVLFLGPRRNSIYILSLS